MFLVSSLLRLAQAGVAMRLGSSVLTRYRIERQKTV